MSSLPAVSLHPTFSYYLVTRSIVSSGRFTVVRNYKYKDHIDSYWYSYILLILYIIWFQGKKCRRNLRSRCGYPAASFSHLTIRINLYDNLDIKSYYSGGLLKSFIFV